MKDKLQSEKYWARQNELVHLLNGILLRQKSISVVRLALNEKISSFEDNK